MPPKASKKRPGTAGRKSKNNLGGKYSIGGGALNMYSNQGQPPLAPLSAKTVAIEQEVMKLRPRVVL